MDSWAVGTQKGDGSACRDRATGAGRSPDELLAAALDATPSGIVSDDGDALLCEIADDGRGFDPDVVRERPGAALHAGLDTLSERIRSAGGETSLDTARGRGTRVRVRIPIPPAS